MSSDDLFSTAACHRAIRVVDHHLSSLNNVSVVLDVAGFGKKAAKLSWAIAYQAVTNKPTSAFERLALRQLKALHAEGKTRKTYLTNVWQLGRPARAHSLAESDGESDGDDDDTAGDDDDEDEDEDVLGDMPPLRIRGRDLEDICQNPENFHGSRTPLRLPRFLPMTF